jgi:hypothetical protein
MIDANFESNWDDTLPKTEKEVTEFIRRRTELWRESWIINPLELALEKLNKNRKK